MSIQLFSLSSSTGYPEIGCGVYALTMRSGSAFINGIGIEIGLLDESAKHVGRKAGFDIIYPK
jgi:hypothetical protein